MDTLAALWRVLPGIDWVALAAFFATWVGYAQFARRHALGSPSLLGSSNRERERWMWQAAARDNRVFDGVVVQNLSASPSFFASTTILIIGGLLAVLSSTEKVSELVREVPFAARTSTLVFDLKVVLLLAVFVFAFFRFTWSLRQYSFGALLVASAPSHVELLADEAQRQAFADRASRVMALAALVALVTADPADPSMNAASGHATRNFLGSAGAFFADFTLQTLGIGVIALILPLAAWGVYLMLGHRVTRWGLRLVALPLAAILLAGAFAILPPMGILPTKAGLGGVIGTTLVNLCDSALALGGLQDFLIVAALLAGVGGFVFLLFSAQLTFGAVGRLDGLVGAYRNVCGAVTRGERTPDDAAEELRRADEEADADYLLEQMPRAVERSLEGLGRVATIVRSLKEFAHPERKEKAWADLNRGILSTLTIARNEYKYIAELDTQLGELPEVFCHLGELNQVILNLVINAAHAIADANAGSEKLGTIQVSTRRDGEHVEIAVRDSGTGIPAEIREKIFDPFFTTKEVGKGTGQGLAIVHSVVVEKHGGSIHLDSTVGKGTTFTLRIPIHGTDAAVARRTLQLVPMAMPAAS